MIKKVNWVNTTVEGNDNFPMVCMVKKLRDNVTNLYIDLETNKVFLCSSIDYGEMITSIDLFYGTIIKIKDIIRYVESIDSKGIVSLANDKVGKYTMHVSEIYKEEQSISDEDNTYIAEYLVEIIPNRIDIKLGEFILDRRLLLGYVVRKGLYTKFRIAEINTSVINENYLRYGAYYSTSNNQFIVIDKDLLPECYKDSLDILILDRQAHLSVEEVTHLVEEVAEPIVEDVTKPIEEVTKPKVGKKKVRHQTATKVENPPTEKVTESSDNVPLYVQDDTYNEGNIEEVDSSECVVSDTLISDTIWKEDKITTSVLDGYTRLDYNGDIYSDKIDNPIVSGLDDYIPNSDNLSYLVDTTADKCVAVSDKRGEVYDKRGEVSDKRGEVSDTASCSKFIKHDSGKPRMSLIDPYYQEDTAKVLTDGAIKYGTNNWQKCEDISRYIDALERHIIDYKKGIIYDVDSGLHQMAHISCNAMFLHYFDRLILEGAIVEDTRELSETC